MLFTGAKHHAQGNLEKKVFHWASSFDGLESRIVEKILVARRAEVSRLKTASRRHVRSA